MSIAVDRLRSRLISTRFGKKIWAYQCGRDLCKMGVHQGRVIDSRRGKLVWGVASECRWQPWNTPCGATITFVRKDRWPPFGVTKCIRFKLFAGGLITCAADTNLCPEIDLVWDGTDQWVGDYVMDNGTMHVVAQLTSTPDPSHAGYYVWQVTISGCVSPTVVITQQFVCAFPMTVSSGGTTFQITTSCCSTAGSGILVYTSELHGFTERARPARLVATRNGKKVWASSYCCPTDSRCVLACCNCLASPAEYTLVVSGVTDLPVPPNPPHGPCTCVDTSWLLRYTDSSGGGGGCRYLSQNMGGCGQWTLSCDNNTQQWILAFAGTSPPAGIGAATYATSFANWNCLGQNTLAYVNSTAGTCSWPGTLLVTPV